MEQKRKPSAGALAKLHAKRDALKSAADRATELYHDVEDGRLKATLDLLTTGAPALYDKCSFRGALNVRTEKIAMLIGSTCYGHLHLAKQLNVSERMPGWVKFSYNLRTGQCELEHRYEDPQPGLTTDLDPETEYRFMKLLNDFINQVKTYSFDIGETFRDHEYVVFSTAEPEKRPMADIKTIFSDTDNLELHTLTIYGQLIKEGYKTDNLGLYWLD